MCLGLTAKRTAVELSYLFTFIISILLQIIMYRKKMATTNDPLYLEEFIPTLSVDLFSIEKEINHFPGFEGLMPLINETYEHICHHSLNFKRSLSLSMYAYYIGVLSWARTLYLKKKNNYQLTKSERGLVENVYIESNYVLPKYIKMYLSGFGNIEIPSSVESKFNTKQYLYDKNGFFKDMENLFYLTASYPNISLFAERITYDIAYTNDPEIGFAWQPNKVARVWTTRCIGYAESVRLSEMQLQSLRRAGITDNAFPADINDFSLSVSLMNIVNKYLLEVSSLESEPLPTNVKGSIGQLLLNDVDLNVAAVAGLDDIGAASFTSKSPFYLFGSIQYLGGSFMYRVNKDLLPSDAKFFFPYNIPLPTKAQVGVLNTLNTGWDPLLNITHFENNSFKPILRLKKFMSIDVK